jgi:hypothetical protein
VKNPAQKTDYVFNYGIFDFSKPYFIYRFASGETDYMLGVYPYADFLVDYQLRGSEVYEQILDLDERETESLLQALIVNARPENRVYRYNFFYDNCSTRPVVLLERIIDGKIVYAPPARTETFRTIINRCTRNHPWITFGCDIVLGSPTDRTITQRESFFLPEYVKNAFSGARIIRPDGTERPLVSAEHVLVESIPDETAPSFFTPAVCGTLLFLAVLLVTLVEWRQRKYFRWLDGALFLGAGMAGCILFFLCFFSVHPSIWPNVSVLWLHPFHIAGAMAFTVKKLNRAAYSCHFINFVALLLMPAGWLLIPQHLNIAFIPLVASLWIRSGYCLVRKKEHIG